MRTPRSVLRLVFLAGLAALALSCNLKGERQPYTHVGPDADALRAAFNADIGRVRLIVLVAPT